MTTMVSPTDEQVRQYGVQLPEIYRVIIRAFPECEPDRREGYGLSLETIYDHFPEEAELGLDDVEEAIDKLAERDFVTVNEVGGVYPTPLGERLITALTGHVPRRAKVVPELPAPPWSLPG